jgi:hypothetical protein
MAPGATVRRLVTAAEVDAAIVASPRILAAGMAKARHAQEIWQAQIPEFVPHGRSRRGAPPSGAPGDARRSIRIQVIRHRAKIAWRIGSDSFVVRMMEFGSKHMPKIAAREKTIAQLRGGG